MTPLHPHWRKFCAGLMTAPGPCEGDHRYSRAVLAGLGFSPHEIRASINYFEANQCACDCQVLFCIEHQVGGHA